MTRDDEALFEALVHFVAPQRCYCPANEHHGRPQDNPCMTCRARAKQDEFAVAVIADARRKGVTPAYIEESIEFFNRRRRERDERIERDRAYSREHYARKGGGS